MSVSHVNSRYCQDVHTIADSSFDSMQLTVKQSEVESWFKVPEGRPSMWGEGKSDQVISLCCACAFQEACSLYMQRQVSLNIRQQCCNALDTTACAVNICSMRMQEVMVKLAVTMVADEMVMRAAVQRLKSQIDHYNQIFATSIPLFRLLASEEQKAHLLATFDKEYPVSSQNICHFVPCLHASFGS